MPKTLPNANLLDHKMSKAYTEYCKKNNVPASHRMKGRKELFTIVRVILKHIARHLVDNKGGVMIRGFGYFFIWKIPRKMSYHLKTRGQKVVEKFNHGSDHKMFSPIFYPTAGKGGMRGWSMDNKFASQIKDGMKVKIRAGFKYKIYPYSLKKLLNY